MRLIELEAGSANLTAEEISIVRKNLTKLARGGEDTLAFDHFKLGCELKLPKYIMKMIQSGAELENSIHKTELISPRKIAAQSQDGVSIEHMRRLLRVINKCPLPEFLALPNGKFWVIEGHHRLMIQLLAGRKAVTATVEYNPDLK